MKNDSWVPQYGDKALSDEQLAYKAGTGSYKASDALLSLLQFTAIAALGPRAFETLSVSELQQALNAKYLQACPPSENKEAMSLAVRWAWPPMDNHWIVFDALELMQAVKGLCLLLQQLPQETVVQHLVAAYAHDSLPDEAYLELGKSLQQLGFLRATLQASGARHTLLLQGFDPA
jgi:hypothetical protein